MIILVEELEVTLKNSKALLKQGKEYVVFILKKSKGKLQTLQLLDDLKNMNELELNSNGDY